MLKQALRLKVGFVLMPRFTLTAFSTFLDVLRLAADEGDRSRPIACAWEVMSPRLQPVKSSCGIEIQPTSDLTEPGRFDYVVIVGGLLGGTSTVAPEIAAYLKKAAAAGVKLAGICTGSFVLARLGLMKGRQCCVSWYHYGDFVQEFAELTPVADRLYVIDGDRITCSGGAGVADLAANLVSRHVGAAPARKAMHILNIERPRSEEAAQPAPPFAMESEDWRVSRALLLMEQNLSEPLSVQAIAKVLGLGVRQLERHFHASLGVSPQESYMALRLKHARWMLEHTTLSTAQIASELGFSDSSHFCRSFKARYSLTPSGLRQSAGSSKRRSIRSKSGSSLERDNADRRVFE